MSIIKSYFEAEIGKDEFNTVVFSNFHILYLEGYRN